MASKRTTHEEGNDERDSQVQGKRRLVYSEQPNTLYLASDRSNSRNGNDMLEFGKWLQEMLPRILEKELPPALEKVLPPILQRYRCPCCGLDLSLHRQQIGTSGGKALKLCFMNRLRSKIFTSTKITAHDGSRLQIALCEYDAKLQQLRVKEDASSLRVQIFVLNGHFGSNGSEDFTAEDFKANILGPREGKRPLLGTDTFVTLKKGVGYVDNAFFTDTSYWTTNGLFRLGLKVDESTSMGADIMEGRSEPFKVMDKRGEAYEKHDRLSLNDEVWRVHMIAKTGKIRRQLSSKGIKTVKDMLRRYTMDEASLRQSIGNVRGKSWRKLIKHAKSCELDDHERYIYEYVSEEHSVSLVFNCIYEVVEVSFNGQNFCSLESLNPQQERLVEIVKKQAYSNLNDLKPYEPIPHSLVQSIEANISYQALPQFNIIPIAQQDPFIYNLTGQGQQQQQQQQTWQNLYQPSTSHIDEAAISDQACSSQLQDHHSGEWDPYITDTDLIGQNPEYSTSCFRFTTPPTNIWEQVYSDSLCTPCVYGTDSSKPVHTSTIKEAKKIWRKFGIVINIIVWYAKFALQRKTKGF